MNDQGMSGTGVLAAVDPTWRTFGEIRARVPLQPIHVRRALEGFVVSGLVERRGDDEYRLAKAASPR